MLDSITFSAAFIRNGRLDVIGVNALGRALHAAMFDSPTARGGRANFARYHFLDPGSREFFLDWEGGRRDGRPAAGRGGACAARHGAAGADRRALHGQRAVQRVLGLPRHPHPPRGAEGAPAPDVGELELTYQSTEIPLAQRGWHDLTFYTAEPGTAHEERLRLLASWHATGAAQEPGSGASLHPGS